jgi:hypothetical protein
MIFLLVLAVSLTRRKSRLSQREIYAIFSSLRSHEALCHELTLSLCLGVEKARVDVECLRVDDLEWRKFILDIRQLVEDHVRWVQRKNGRVFRLELLETGDFRSGIGGLSAGFESRQLVGMCFLLMTAAIRAVGKGFVAPVELKTTKKRRKI